MKIATDDRIYLVTDPEPGYCLADTCCETSIFGMGLQFRGGLSPYCNPTIHTSKKRALADARARLAAMGGGE